MQVNVVSATQGKRETALEVSDRAFAAPFNEPLVHQVVTAYQAGTRAGTRAQKNRAAARGGGTKPWRQKGTGHARVGTIRSPLWRGGAVAFAARPKSYAQKINRKMYRAGIRAILSELLRQGRLVVVEALSIEQPKTKALLERLERLQTRDALIVTEALDRNLMRAARNVPRVEVCDVPSADPVSLIRHDKVVVTVGALKRFEEWLG